MLLTQTTILRKGCCKDATHQRGSFQQLQSLMQIHVLDHTTQLYGQCLCSWLYLWYIFWSKAKEPWLLVNYYIISCPLQISPPILLCIPPSSTYQLFPFPTTFPLGHLEALTRTSSYLVFVFFFTFTNFYFHTFTSCKFRNWISLWNVKAEDFNSSRCPERKKKRKRTGEDGRMGEIKRSCAC